MDRCQAQKVFVLHWQTFPTGVVLGVVGEVAGVGGAAGEQWVYPLTRFLAQKPFAASNALYLLAKVAWLGSELHVNSRDFLSHLSQIVPPLTASAILFGFVPHKLILVTENARYEQFSKEFSTPLVAALFEPEMFLLRKMRLNSPHLN